MHFNPFHAFAIILLAPLVATQTSSGKIVKGIDTGHAVSEATFKKAYEEGFTHYISRGYNEVGAGGIDANFLQNTINAWNAGYKGKYDMDTYWFPCSGKGRNCKPYDTQVKEFVNYIRERSIPVGRIYLNIEVDKTKIGNWNYGRNESGGNLAEAQKMMQALKAVAPNSGIYSNHGEWWNIFGDFNAVVDNSVPLWYALWDYTSATNKFMPPTGMEFGGWQNSQIVGKQYSNESASGLFDLNLFVIPQ